MVGHLAQTLRECTFTGFLQLDQTIFGFLLYLNRRHCLVAAANVHDVTVSVRSPLHLWYLRGNATDHDC
jgi:hypothetical protein